MKKLIALFLLTIHLSSCGGAGDVAAPQLPPPPPLPTASELLANSLRGLNFDRFYDVSFRALIQRTPETILWQALTSEFPLDGVKLDNFSDSFRRETIAMHQVVLDALRLIDRSLLSARDQLTYDYYEWHLQDVVDSLPFIYYEFVANYNFSGIESDMRRFFTDIHPLASADDARDLIARLGLLRLKFSQVIDFLNRQLAAGIVEPRLTLDVSISILNDLLSTSIDQIPYFTSFADRLDAIAGLTANEKDALLASLRQVISDSVLPAYRDLRDMLQSLRSRAPQVIGVGQYPNGAAYYEYALRHHTTTSLTAAEIHQLGLDELARIHAEMRAVFDLLGYPQNETLPQLFNRVAIDGGIIPADNALAAFQDLISFAEQNVGQAFDIFPSAAVVVREDQYGGFYISPSFDGTRPGAFYAGTGFDQPYFEMPTLTFHESVPGHHTQIAIQMDLDLPVFRKTSRVTAFVEGWALYAERLAYELGWYDGDPYGNLGRLQLEALRAARLVMDTGIHSMGWTFAEATQFNIDNVGASVGASEGAAARYSVVPGQATAYMIGMLQILNARQRAMDQLGPQFDLREFHRVVLTSGAIPLALLDGVVDRYIAEKAGTPQAAP